MRIVLTGGGTGGHVIPNLAVIEELKKRDGVDIFYIGSKDGIEEKLVKRLGVRYEGVHCGKFRRYFSWQNFVDIFKVPAGVWEAKKILREYEPSVVFSKGGYVSVPVVYAAKKLRIPLVVHESDVSPGLANKFAFSRAEKICVSFEETKSYIPKDYEEKVVWTGSPIREEILSGDREAGYRMVGFDKHRPVLLIMGGSQGAEQINELVRAGLDELLKKFQIVHLVGKGNLDISVKRTGYVQYEYLEQQMKDVLAMCDMAITRGGANSLFELAILGKKALVIPLTGEATRGDQELNAAVFVRKFGWSMISGDISREDFISNVELAFENEFNREAKVKNGSKEIVDIILKSV
ncbi:MAG: undecaprenyldiphospho-muramoylpentapeptide beta-N-acetylglucosaminyltransferase [Candidatus Peregrinibacteria bacterium]